MGADQSQLGCGAGVRSLFSRAEWRELRQHVGTSVQLAASGRYHYNRSLDTKYELTSDILGTGMSGPVRLALGRASTPMSHRQFAVKTFKKHTGRDPLVKREVKIFLLLDHPNIARLEDVFETRTEIHLVMERLGGGELFDRIVARGAYAENVAAAACGAMFQAVAYLHGQSPPIVHRDLKPENFLYEKPDSDHLKLIDFGLSTFWDSRVSPKISGACGSQGYMAPEVLAHRTYTEKCDIFALGVIAYILLTGHPPFSSASAEDFRVYKPFQQAKFKRLSPEAQSFVQGLLMINPVERPSAVEVLANPWMKGGGQLEVEAIDIEVLRSMKYFSTTSHFRRACLFMMAWSLNTEDCQHLRTCFMKMDTNRDGRISLNEMGQALEDNFSINCDEAAELFRKLGTGGNDEICYSEFLAAAMHERVRMHEDALWATFSRFDKSGTGVISTDDLHALLNEGFEGVDIAELMREVDPKGQGGVSCKAFVEYLMLDEDAAMPSTGTVKLALESARESELNSGDAEELAPLPLPGSWHKRTSLAARLIDRERQREPQNNSVHRPWKSFMEISTRSDPVIMDGPLQRVAGVQTWA